MDDPCDEWPALQDMAGVWHVKLSAYPGARLGFAGVALIMSEVMAYFEETGFA